MIDSLECIPAVLRTFLAALMDIGVQSLRFLKPTTTAITVLELIAVANDKKAVQPQSAAGFKSRNRATLLKEIKKRGVRRRLKELFQEIFANFPGIIAT
jgi:hypothetical protein